MMLSSNEVKTDIDEDEVSTPLREENDNESLKQLFEDCVIKTEEDRVVINMDFLDDLSESVLEPNANLNPDQNLNTIEVESTPLAVAQPEVLATNDQDPSQTLNQSGGKKPYTINKKSESRRHPPKPRAPRRKVLRKRRDRIDKRSKTMNVSTQTEKLLQAEIAIQTTPKRIRYTRASALLTYHYNLGDEQETPNRRISKRLQMKRFSKDLELQKSSNI